MERIAKGRSGQPYCTVDVQDIMIFHGIQDIRFFSVFSAFCFFFFSFCYVHVLLRYNLVFFCEINMALVPRYGDWFKVPFYGGYQVRYTHTQVRFTYSETHA